MVSPELRNSISSPSQDLAQWPSWYWAAEFVARQTFAYPLHLASRKMNASFGSGKAQGSLATRLFMIGQDLEGGMHDLPAYLPCRTLRSEGASESWPCGRRKVIAGSPFGTGLRQVAGKGPLKPMN